MDRDFWQERWEKNELGFHQQEINASLRAYWPRLGVPRDATVFVPLCGKSRDMIWLREQGHRVLGIELISIAVRDFFAENGMTPNVAAQPPFERWEADGITILCGDFFALAPADLADVAVVYDRAALIALPRAMRREYVAKLAAILPRAAETLLITVTYPQEQMPGPPFSVPEHEVHALYAHYFEVVRLHTQDILRKDSPFRARGLTELTAQVYRVRRAARPL